MKYKDEIETKDDLERVPAVCCVCGKELMVLKVNYDGKAKCGTCKER